MSRNRDEMKNGFLKSAKYLRERLHLLENSKKYDEILKAKIGEIKDRYAKNKKFRKYKKRVLKKIKYFFHKNFNQLFL